MVAMRNDWHLFSIMLYPVGREVICMTLHLVLSGSIGSRALFASMHIPDAFA